MSEDPPVPAAQASKVKKILARFMASSLDNLNGPDNANLERNVVPTYNLPPDVELSKTSCHDQDETEEVKPAESKVDLGKSSNGLVTLSRINDEHEKPYSKSDWYSIKPHHSMPPYSSPLGYKPNEGKHLSGDTIVKLRQIHGTSRSVADDTASLVKIPINGETKATKNPPVRGPFLTARDNGLAVPEETNLRGVSIVAFYIGGELRLCVPQIWDTVLSSIDVSGLNTACENLKIYLSVCTSSQLDTLKQRNVLKDTVYDCKLITKSDAERLCSFLLDPRQPREIPEHEKYEKSPFWFIVEHECFGGCYGRLFPEAYTSVDAKCIRCKLCNYLFCPEKFVSHSHTDYERNTCHWGFNASNWRSYLRFSETNPDEKKNLKNLKREFEDVKNRFAGSGLGTKRKSPADSPSRRDNSPNAVTKKSRLSSDSDYNNSAHSDNRSSRMPPIQRIPDEAYVYLNTLMNPNILGSGKSSTLQEAWVQAFKDGKPPVMLRPFHPVPPGTSRCSPRPHQQLPGSQHSFSHNRTNSVHPREQPSVSSSYSEQHLIAQTYNRRRSSSSPPVHHKHPHQGIPHSVRSDPLNLKSSPFFPVDDSKRLSNQAYDSRESPPDAQIANRTHSDETFDLAEDVETIRTALEGASRLARQRTLKIIERWTARIAHAESEKRKVETDHAILLRGFRQLKEQYDKKDAELKELVRQDSSGPERSVTSFGSASDHPAPPDSAPSALTQVASSLGFQGDLVGRPSVNLEWTMSQQPIEMRRRRSSNVSSAAGSPISGKHLNSNVPTEMPGGYLNSNLPKIEMKSPARIIKETERFSYPQQNVIQSSKDDQTPCSSSPSPMIDDNSDHPNPVPTQFAGAPSTNENEQDVKEMKNALRRLESQVLYLQEKVYEKNKDRESPSRSSSPGSRSGKASSNGKGE